jgi:polysaccharide biosynthesis transport protein
MYFDVLARRWKIVLLVTLGGIVLAVIAALFISPRYQAEAMLRIVTPLGGSSGDTNYQTTFATRLVNTYAQIATSEQVNNELKLRLGVRVLPNISVKVIPDSEIIQIIVKSDSAALASKTANTLTDILLSNQDSVTKSSDSNELSILDARKKEIQAQLTQYQEQHDQLIQTYSQTTADMAVLDGKIKSKEASYQSLQEQYENIVISEAVYANYTTGATKGALTKEIDRILKELDGLNQQYKDLSTESNRYLQQITLIRQSIQNTQGDYSDLIYRYDSVLLANSRQENAQNNIETVSPASEPTAPTGLGRFSILTLGLIIGLIAGVATAFVIDNLDTRIFSLEQIGRVTSAPIIGSVSKFEGHPSQDIEKNPILQRDYRLLRAKLQTLIHDGSIKSIMVTSPNRMEGKSTIVFRLASELAQSKLKVLVVDANLRKPKQHELFNVTAKRGLTDFLESDREGIKSVILRDVKPGIDLLPNLTESDNPSALFQSPRWKSLFESIQAYDTVLFDTPALLVVPDAMDFGEAIDGVIIIAEWGHTTSGDIQSMCSILDSVGSKIVGIIANQFPSKKKANSYDLKLEQQISVKSEEGQQKKISFKSEERRSPL